MFKHILIPTDGSALSMKAVKSGVALAKDAGAKITVLTVIEPTGVLGTDSRRVTATRQAHERQVRDFAERELHDAERSAKKQGVACTTILQKHTQPYQAIIDTATKRGCDLIAMASHGRKGVTALILGSETNKVLIHSRIPVLVYRFKA
jgi:nucleotide-binding universal stress UspA family protein